MNAEKTRVSVEQFFTEDQLIAKAAGLYGLVLCDGRDCGLLASELAKYPLEGKLLAEIHKRKYEIRRLDDYFGVIDTGPAKMPEGWSYTTGWGFKTAEEPKIFTLSVRFKVDNKNRGVRCLASVFGSSSGSAAAEPNERFFNMITEIVPDAHPFIKKIVEAKHNLVIGWGEIGLGGIRTVNDLFFEFISGNRSLEDLGRSGGSPFAPAVLRDCFLTRGVPDYVPEPLHAQLFEQWAEQLQKYRDSLARY